MTDRAPFDGPETHLSERMERAVGDLRAPDVVAPAMAHGRRRRTHRRLAYAAGGVAAATALALAVPALASDRPDPAPPVAADPAPTDPAGPPPTSPTGPPSGATTSAPEDPCGASATGWWSKPPAQVVDDLSALLPGGVGIGGTDDEATGTWGGDLTSGSDADFASLTLLPPPGTPGGQRSLGDLADGGPCFGGSNEPLQAVRPCAELTGSVACREIRARSGLLVGVVTERVEQTIVDGQEEPTDRTYVLGTITGPEGGHVELYVAEGTRADRPHTVHDPADVPALTMDQVREIVTDPVWTS